MRLHRSCPRLDVSNDTTIAEVEGLDETIAGGSRSLRLAPGRNRDRIIPLQAGMPTDRRRGCDGISRPGDPRPAPARSCWPSPAQT
jgi:hypothetical protein